MLQEVEEYFTTKQALQDAYEERQRQNQADLNAAPKDTYVAEQEARTRYYARNDASEALHNAERRVAWLRLSLSGDALVRYIATRVPDHQREQGEKVLRRLPATVMQLREIAAEEDWCRDFTGHLTNARREGYIVDDRDAAEAALEDWVESNVANRYAPELFKRIDAVVKARVAKAAEPEVSQIQADLEGEHEVQLGRVDAVWSDLASYAPPTIEVASAEHLFRQAVHAVITGQGEMFADFAPGNELDEGPEELEPVF